MTLIINTSRAIHWFMALLMGSVFYAVSSATSMNLTAHEPGEVTAGFYEPAINFVDRPLPDGVADISPFVQCVRNITGQHVVVSLISWGSSAEYALWWYDGDIDSTEIYEGVVPEFAECYDLLDNSTEVSTWAIGLYPTMGHWDIISDIDMFFRLYDEGTPSFYQPELLEPDVLNTTVIATGCVAKRGNDDPPNMLGGHQWL